MGKEEPESKDWLGEDIENGVGDDLSINIDVARSISNTPDAIYCQLVMHTMHEKQRT